MQSICQSSQNRSLIDGDVWYFKLWQEDIIACKRFPHYWAFVREFHRWPVARWTPFTPNGTRPSVGTMATFKYYFSSKFLQPVRIPCKSWESIWIKIQQFTYMKTSLKMPSITKWWPFCPGLNLLIAHNASLSLLPDCYYGDILTDMQHFI